MLLWLPFLAIALSAQAEDREEIPHRLPRTASVFPQGAAPGTTLEVEILGQDLDHPSGLIFLEPGIEGRISEGRHTRLAASLDIAPDARPGPHYFRVLTRRGASNVLLFRVGDQPHALESEPNGRLGEVQSIRVPATVNGRLDRVDDIDIFRFRPSAGGVWIFDLRSARNGSGLDPSLILLDAEGRKLGHSEDHFIWDPFFSREVDSDGEYFLVVQPTRGRARPTHGYQLDVRQAPHLSGLSPIALSAGATAEVTLHGAGLSDGQAKVEFSSQSLTGEVVAARGDLARLRIGVGPDVPAGRHSLALRTPQGRSNELEFWVHDLPLHRGGGRLAVPSALVGRARYERPQHYAFAAGAGETLVFAVRAQQLGSPVDMVLRIVGGAKESILEIAENDDASLPGIRFNKDPKIVHTFEEAGEYELQARSLWRSDAPVQPFFLEVRTPRPRLELLLDSDSVAVPLHGEGRLGVSVHRIEGHAGGAELRVEGLPAWIRADPVQLPPESESPSATGAEPAKVEFAFRAEGEAASHAAIRVVEGRGGARAWRNARISSGGGEGATQTRVDEVAIAVAERPRFELEAQRSTVVLVRGGRATLPVDIRRESGFAGAVQLDFENLPGGVSFEPQTAGGLDAQVEVVLEAGQDAVKGSHSGVAVLASGPDGTTEQAPAITVVVN